jgi:integrase/recombinase XerD
MMEENNIADEQKQSEFHTTSEKAKLREVIEETIKLWRKHHLDYNQVGYITKSARKNLEISRVKPRTQIIQRLSQEEVQSIINLAYQKKGLYGLIIKVLFFSGCRVNELVNIKAEHINFSENEIYIEMGKGQKQRYVPIFPFLKQELLTHLADRRQGYLFESRLNDKFSTRRIQQIVKQVSKEAGINRNVYPHLFRKSIATFLLNKGMPIDQVQQFLGHSKLETTQIYAKTSIQNLKDNYQKLIEG